MAVESLALSINLLPPIQLLSNLKEGLVIVSWMILHLHLQLEMFGPPSRFAGYKIIAAVTYHLGCLEPPLPIKATR